MNNIYKKYEEARDRYFIKKKWIKSNPDLMKQEYTDKGLSIPCDGLVKAKEDAKNAVLFFTAFFQKLKYENKLTNEIEESFKKTIEKYSNYE